MPPPRRVEHRASEVLLPGHVLGKVGRHEAAYSIHSYLSFLDGRLSRLRVDSGYFPQTPLFIPFRIGDGGVEDGVRSKPVFAPDAFPVRAQLGLLSKIARPVWIQLA